MVRKVKKTIIYRERIKNIFYFPKDCFLKLYTKREKVLEQLKTEKQRNFKFLVMRNGLIGDTVFITPVIYKLNREYKNSLIDVVVNDNSKEILNNFTNINNLFSLPSKFSIKNHLLFFLSLRKYAYDCVLIQEMNTHYSIMAKLLGAKLIIGYKNSLSKLHDISIERKGHAVPAEQLLVNYITGCTDINQTLLFTTSEEDAEGKVILQENGVEKNNIICVQFACSEKNSVRQLPIEKVAFLADRLNLNTNAQVIFLGTKWEILEIEKIRSLMKSPSISLAGKTNLRNLISILKIASLVIGPDTGTLHIANAVGTPTVMYMGYSGPDDTGPFDKSNRSKVITSNLECIPCKYTNPKPSNWDYCKQNRPTLCMEKIVVNDIINAADSILNY